ncbi:MAG: hypothetical protein VZR27_13555, partial [Acutalibacteraceae bacterium]|nr:hypothetical protein [Acutalibacteraceae bacterium]
MHTNGKKGGIPSTTEPIKGKPPTPSISQHSGKHTKQPTYTHDLLFFLWFFGIVGGYIPLFGVHFLNPNQTKPQKIGGYLDHAGGVFRPRRGG